MLWYICANTVQSVEKYRKMVTFKSSISVEFFDIKIRIALRFMNSEVDYCGFEGARRILLKILWTTKHNFELNMPGIWNLLLSWTVCMTEVKIIGLYDTSIITIIIIVRKSACLDSLHDLLSMTFFSKIPWIGISFWHVLMAIFK